MTAKELYQAKRKMQRQGFKMIENNLHPTPEINGAEVLHEHKGQYVIFTAWIKDVLANQKILKFRREYCMTESKFYELHQEDFAWLARTE